MTDTFERSLKRLLGVEGDFSDHPADSGGKTRWGVTEALARMYGYQGPMRAYPLAHAQKVYHLHFWQPLNLDDVARAGSEELAYELFEQAVNMGRERPARFLQRLLNVLNQQGALYADIVEDGIIGPNTIRALKSYEGIRGREGIDVLLKGLNVLQGAFYIELAERRQKDEAFLYGWLSQRTEV